MKPGVATQSDILKFQLTEAYITHVNIDIALSEHDCWLTVWLLWWVVSKLKKGEVGGGGIGTESGSLASTHKPEH